METTAPTPRIPWYRPLRRRRMAELVATFELGYRIGERDGHEAGYQDGRDDA